MTRSAVTIVLDGFAHQVADIADLDDDSRQLVMFEFGVGDYTLAIYAALMNARSPLPRRALGQIAQGIRAGWYAGVVRDYAATAVVRQLAAYTA